MNKDRKLETAIEDLDIKGGRDFSDMFYEFLEMALGLLCNNPSEHQKRLLTSTMSDDRKRMAFAEALNAYGEAAENYHDPLGEMFMMRISHGNNGQFFTPQDLCDLMAHITEPIGETVNDPTCGSGRLLLSALKTSRDNGKEPIVYGNDLSYTCAQMCLMNLLFNSARGEVSCGDALLMNLDTFRFFRIDRVLMPDGKWMSTYWQYTLSDVDEVDRERREWKMLMLNNGMLVETLPVPKSEESGPKGTETVPNTDDFVPKDIETRQDRLTAKPKAVQLQLELF